MITIRDEGFRPSAQVHCIAQVFQAMFDIPLRRVDLWRASGGGGQCALSWETGHSAVFGVASATDAADFFTKQATEHGWPTPTIHPAKAAP